MFPPYPCFAESVLRMNLALGSMSQLPVSCRPCSSSSYRVHWIFFEGHGGGIRSHPQSPSRITIRNTIMAFSAGETTSTSPVARDIKGTVTSGGHNLIRPLVDNGGATLTYLPQSRLWRGRLHVVSGQKNLEDQRGHGAPPERPARHPPAAEVAPSGRTRSCKSALHAT